MSSLLLSLMLAAGVAGFVYSKAGPRLGYGNTQNIWVITGISFVFVFLVVIILLKFLIHL